MNAKKQDLCSQYLAGHISGIDNNNDENVVSSSTDMTFLKKPSRNISTKRNSVQINSTNNNSKEIICQIHNSSSADDLWLRTSNTFHKNEISGAATPPSACSQAGTVNCVTLKHILDSFKAPVSEEQAWAIIYKSVSTFRQIAVTNPHHVFNISEIPETLENLYLHRDGTVHCSWSEPKNKEKQAQVELQQTCIDSRAQLMTSHRKIVRQLGTIVYNALDYNLHEDEQCQMSKELEEVLTHMTTDGAYDDCIDEGIDEGCKRWDDDLESTKSNETKEFDVVLKACLDHIKPAVPEEHYKAVCRALVTETIELGIFLQHILNNRTNDFNAKCDSTASQQELAKLGFNDWARFWVQVIDELRKGVRLKKANYARTPIEYELTPYEILMEDIRSRKYQLRKVMINGDIPPRVKKDAHAMILDFIRSRPPLKKATERKLPPPIKRTPSPRELLMDSIRKGRILKHIKPPPSPQLKHSLFLQTTDAKVSCKTSPTKNHHFYSKSPDEERSTTRSKQRLIKVDFSLLQDDEAFSSDLTSTSTACNATTTLYGNVNTAATINVCAQPKMPPYPIGAYLYSDSMAPKATTNQTTTDTSSSLTSQVTRRTSDDQRRSSLRRHSIVGCQNNSSELPSTSTSRVQYRQADGNALAVIDNEWAEQEQNDSAKMQEEHTQLECIDNGQQPTSSVGPWSKSFMDEKTWNECADDRLSLTLEEIVHIRSVMTKAELESLPVGVRVKEDVEKRKICFLCLRTRFSLFGPWGVECKICKRTVCSKCYTKMRIPTEHFRNVPLVLISPSLLSTPAGSSSPSPSHLAGYVHSSSTGNILDETFSKSLIDRLMGSEATEIKSRNAMDTPPSSPRYHRSNMSTPGIKANELRGIRAGHAVEASHDIAALPLSSLTGITHSSTDLMPNRIYNSYVEQQSNYCKNFNIMSRSMEGPRSLPMQSPASRPHSSSSTLDRKNRFSQKFTLSPSGSHLGRDQKENLRGEEVPVCNDCHGLVMEISRSAKHKRSSARNRTLKKLTLDLSPVWK